MYMRVILGYMYMRVILGYMYMRVILGYMYMRVCFTGSPSSPLTFRHTFVI